MPIDFELTTVDSSDTDPDGFPRVQPRGLGDEPSVLPAVIHQPYGLASVPLDPSVDASGTPAEGCLTFASYDGDQQHALLASDSRITVKLPPRAKGASILYGASSSTDPTKTPSIAMFDSSKHGSFVLLVPHSSGGTSSGIFVDVSTPGAENIAIRHGLGMGMTILAGGTNPTMINNKAGDASVVVDDTGIILNATKISINGACLIGSPAAAVPLALGPAAVAALAALVTVVSGMPGGAGASSVSALLPAILSKKAFAL